MQEAMTKRTIFSNVDNNSIMSYGIIFISIILYYNVFYLCGRAFDFTDESFYIINIQSPSLYCGGSQFGFIYHHLYKLLGNDIFLFRIVDFIIFSILSFILIILVMGIKLDDIFKNTIVMIIALGITTCAIIQNTMNFRGTWTSWLATPSYNSLNFESLLVCMIGVVMTESRVELKKIVGNIFVSFGISLCFLAKPTSAFLFFVLIMLYWLIFSKHKFSFFVLFLAGLCIAMVINAYIVDGSLWDFIVRIKRVITEVNSVDTQHGFMPLFRKLFELPFFIKDKRHLPDSFIIKMSIFPIFCAAFFIYYNILYYRKSGNKILFCCLFYCTFCASILFVFDHFLPVYFTKYISLSTNLSILLIVAIGIVMIYLFDYKNIIDIEFYRNIPTALLFFIIPLLYAFGTDFSYFYFCGKASLFWVLGGVYMAQSTAYRKGWNFLLPFVLTLQLIISFSVSVCKTLPYRQGNNINSLQTDVHIGGGSLKLSDTFARYIGDARSAAAEGGFTPGIPVIDLTGQSPGILYALEAEAVGKAWIIGGRPDDLDWAVYVLQQSVAREKLLQSWILVEPDGQRSLPNTIFERLGLNFPEDYELRAEWQVPKGAGTRNRSAKQQLYAPKMH